MIIVTAGHVDHGKTSLIKALTGTDTDRLPEEKARGMTIDLGFAHRAMPDGRTLTFIDVPGHQRFIRNMLAGVARLDTALLVIAADDGPKAQTLEHLDILDLLGCRELIVVVTKIDRATPSRLDELTADLAELTTRAGFSGAAMFHVSCQTGAGIDDLIAHLDSLVRTANNSDVRGRFRMPIDRVLLIPGAGVVVAGTIWTGEVRIGDHLMLSPGGLEARVRGIQSHGRSADRACNGHRCALNITGAGVEKSRIHRGHWLVDAALAVPTHRVIAELVMPRRAPVALKREMPVHVHLGTANTLGRIRVLETGPPITGQPILAQITLHDPVGALFGDRLILRDASAKQTLAGGRIIDPFPPSRGGSKLERIRLINLMREPDTLKALTTLVAETAVDWPTFRVSRHLSDREADAILARTSLMRVANSPLAVSPALWQKLQSAVLDALAAWHGEHPELAGRSAAEVRTMCASALVTRTLVDAAIAALVAEGRIVRRGLNLRLAEHRPTLNAKDHEMWARVQPLVRGEGYRPLRVREIADTLDVDVATVEKILLRAHEAGYVFRVAANRYFLPETLLDLARMARALADDAPDHRFTASQFKDRSGIGRNLTIPLLEFFDRIGLTRRVGDARELTRTPEEIFGPGES